MNDIITSDTDKLNNDGVESLKWQFTYDKQNRISQIASPGNRIMNVEYQTNPKNNNIEKVIQQHSDEMKVVYEFDQYQRRKKMINSSGEVDYRYDKYHRLSSVQRSNIPGTIFKYDIENRLTHISIEPFFSCRIVYDFLGRIECTETPLGDITYQYLGGQNKKIRTLPNGVSTIWDYKHDGLLDSLTHVFNDNRILAKFDYSYRPDGLIRQIHEWRPDKEIVLDYQYDSVLRIIEVSDSQGHRFSYQYDKLGNRLSSKQNGAELHSATYNWAGQLMSRNDKPCKHDGAGNLTGYHDGTGNRSFQHNEMNLMTSSLRNGRTVYYEFDGDGNLISRKTDGGNHTKFVTNPFSDKWQPFLAVDHEDNHTSYFWDGDLPIACLRNGKAMFFLHDHIGSVRFVVDKEAQVIQTYEFKPFGEPVKELIDDFTPGFAGLFYDTLAGVSITRGRSYDPHLGRFLQIDPQHRIPTGSQNEASLYSYCGNDPINYTDRDGRYREHFQAGTPNILKQWHTHQ